MSEPKDIYDEAINYLLSVSEDLFPDLVDAAWGDPTHIAGGALFLFADANAEGDFPKCGCLTQIHAHSNRVSSDSKLTAEIKADPGIPNKSSDITPESLEVFAKYQRKLDKRYKERRDAIMKMPCIAATRKFATEGG